MWEKVKLRDICELVYGKALAKEDRLESDGFPAYGANGVKTYAINFLYDKPSIIVGRKGSAGELQKVDAPFWALDVTYYVVHKEELVILEYLYLLLKLQNLPALAKGVKPGINRNDVYNINVLLPPLTEQQRIVAKLDAVFAEIDKAVAAAEHKQKQVEVLTYNTIEERLSQIEKGAGTERLADVVSIQPKKKMALDKITKDDQVSFMGMNRLGIHQKFSSPDETRTLADVYKSYQYFENNDVLLAKITPCFENGKLSIANNLQNGIGFGSSEFVVIRPSDRLTSSFVYYNLLRQSFRVEGKSNMSGAVGHKRVTKEFIQNHPISCPSLSKQESLSKLFDDILGKVDVINTISAKQIQNYQSLKASILSQELKIEAA